MTDSEPTPEAPTSASTPDLAASAEIVDPFANYDDEKPKNFGRVGSVRPTALLYTAGIGATVDLPHLAVMPQGLESWEGAYTRMGGPDIVAEPRLVEAVRAQLGRQVAELRRPPRQDLAPREIPRLGVPAAVFPRWLRCTSCDLLAPFEGDGGSFTYINVIGMRPDQAKFVHKGCKGRQGSGKGRDAIAVPARYLIACLNGHLDEFPYAAYVHRAQGSTWTCPKRPGAVNPVTQLKMREWRSNIGPEVQIVCVACEQQRSMRELTGTAGADRMPSCRGRHPHLGTFEKNCEAETKFMLLGAANQWFPATISLLVIPQSKTLTAADVAVLLSGVPAETRDLVTAEAAVPIFKVMVGQKADLDLSDVPDALVWEALQRIATGIEDGGRTTPYDRVELLNPEWDTLVQPGTFTKHARENDFRIRDAGVVPELTPVIETVAAVDRLKKVNAFVGFTRIDSFDRVGDAPERIAPLARRRPTWVPATEDRGEGVFVRLREDVVAPWEEAVLASDLWELHRAAHQRNFERRTSSSAQQVEADARLAPPRFWAAHTMSHLLIRQMAMDSGYGSASLTERIYAWRGDDERDPAAGFLISTTSPDSEGTLGGLVELASPEKLARMVARGLSRATRCSSDPVCAHRVPRGQEDFLHGAACHFCAFLSETSCENANRFLDRRFAVTLLGEAALARGLFEEVTPA